MKEIIELPDELLVYIKARANELVNATTTFFEYILIPRDNYIEITPEMNPRINDKMLNYVIQNILGVVVNSENKYTIDYNTVFKLSEIDSEYSINDIFVYNMSTKLRNTMAYLNPENSPIITEQGMEAFKTYIDHVLNEALLTLSDGDIDMDLKDIYKNHNIREYLSENINNEGDNVIFPKNYNFNDDDDNIIVQAFVWVMCGINDWLEKDYIEEEDVKYMAKIIFGNLYSDMLSDADVNEDIKLNIKEALFLSDFYTSDKAANLMSKLFSNIKEQFDNDVINKHVKQFSIVI